MYVRVFIETMTFGKARVARQGEEADDRRRVAVWNRKTEALSSKKDNEMYLSLNMNDQGEVLFEQIVFVLFSLPSTQKEVNSNKPLHKKRLESNECSKRAIKCRCFLSLYGSTGSLNVGPRERKRATPTYLKEEILAMMIVISISSTPIQTFRLVD